MCISVTFCLVINIQQYFLFWWLFYVSVFLASYMFSSSNYLLGCVFFCVFWELSVDYLVGFSIFFSFPLLCLECTKRTIRISPSVPLCSELIFRFLNVYGNIDLTSCFHLLIHHTTKNSLLVFFLFCVSQSSFSFSFFK